jgi:hypothetical protein
VAYASHFSRLATGSFFTPGRIERGVGARENDRAVEERPTIVVELIRSVIISTKDTKKHEVFFVNLVAFVVHFLIEEFHHARSREL